MPAKKYRVTLLDEERRYLQEVVSRGQAAARTLAHARILLKADEARAALTAAGIEHEPIPDVGTPGSMPAPPVPMYGSTWMDFHLGRGKHETDYFNGEIVRLGQRHGVATPANALILDLAHAAARDGLPPGSHTLGDLRRRVAGHADVSS